MSPPTRTKPLGSSRARWAILLGPALVLGACSEPSGPVMELRLVLSEVLLEEPEWTVREARPDGAPHVDVLCPSRDLRIRGADLPTLVLPPPASVELALKRTGPGVRLDLRFGVDEKVFLEPPESLEGGALGFEVRAGEGVIFEGRLPLVSVGNKPGSEWIVADGLELGGADSITLTTRYFDASGREAKPGAALPAGFGGIELVRHLERERELSSPEEPNILLLVMDTQRADRLSAYGYERPTSPALEALAARGLLYENAFATSNWTWPSTASILTGLHPQEHGLLDATNCFLSERIHTLAEALQESGLSTAAWSANYLIAEDKNFDQGFEVFHHAIQASQPSDEVVPDALDWIESVAGTRFFLYLQLMDPHAPLDPPPKARSLFAEGVPSSFPPTAINTFKDCLYKGKGHTRSGELVTERCASVEEQAWIRDLYDACTWTGDRWLGRIVERLEELGLDDETVIVFTSDHGEELFERGLLTHGQSLHRELVRVPLVLAGPGIPVGVRVDTPVSNRFLAPSLAAFAGGRLEADLPGLDLTDPATLSRTDVLFSTATGWWNGGRRLPIYGLLSGEHVLHWAPTGAPWPGRKGEEAPLREGGDWRLFHVGEDPLETRDLAEADPQLTQALRATLQDYLAGMEPVQRDARFSAGEATLERLREMGYIDD